MAIDTIKATAILDGAVDTADLADGAVTSAKIDSTSTGMSLADLAVDTDTLYVDATNNRVGVGTSSPDYPIHSEGSGFNGGRIGIESTDSGTSLEIKGVNGAGINDVAFISLVDGTNDSFIGLTGTAATAGAIRIAPGNTEKVRIDSDGLKFNGDTAAANALDDYEEGTLVPSLSCTNSNAGITYTTQVGKYVKIGNKVHVVLYIELSSKGSASGNVRISGAGFPFTPSSTSGFVQTGHVALNGTASGQQFAGQNDIWGQLAPGDATLRIYADSDGDVVQLDTGDIGNVTSFRVNMSYFV